jgi:hypothetical protein
MIAIGKFRLVAQQVNVSPHKRGIGLRRLILPCLAQTLVMASALSAGAASTTYNVSFSANNFQVGSGGDPAPVDPVMGDFTITLDPTMDVENSTDGITLNDLYIALGSQLCYTYKTAADGAFPPGTLRVGGLNAGSDVIIFDPSTDDFWLFIDDFTGTPQFNQLGYTQTSVSNNNLFYTLDQTGSVSARVVVPEPATLFTIGLGFACLGIIRRRRKGTAGLPRNGNP